MIYRIVSTALGALLAVSMAIVAITNWHALSPVCKVVVSTFVMSATLLTYLTWTERDD